MTFRFLADAVDSNGVGTQTTLTGAMAITGNGGSVTQITSKSTGVTLNTGTGLITMHAANLATLTVVSFTLTNSEITATDFIGIQHQSGGTVGSYIVTATPAAGSAAIVVTNITAGTLGEAIVLRFFRIPSANS